MGDPYAEESEVGADLSGDTAVLRLWGPCRMCVFCIHVVDKYAASYDGRDPHKILSQHERCKISKFIEG